jgi:hypothetical protein
MQSSQQSMIGHEAIAWAIEYSFWFRVDSKEQIFDMWQSRRLKYWNPGKNKGKVLPL